MTRKLVVDANVTIAWLLDEDGVAERIETVLNGRQLAVPSVWQLEVSNVLLVHERRKKLSTDQVLKLLHVLDGLQVDLIPEPSGRTAVALAQLARPHQLTTYDAAYLDLAIRLGLPLFTKDGNLKAAAQRIGIEIVAI